MSDISDYVRVRQISGDSNRGGWQCVLEVMQDTDLLDEHREIIIPWKGAFGPGGYGPLRTAFKGYVIPSRSRFRADRSITEVVAETTDGYLRRMWCQGIGFAEVDARANYHQFSDDDTECPAEIMGYEMTSGKMIAHMLGYYDDCSDIGPDWVAHTNLVKDITHNPEGWITLDHVELAPYNSVTNPNGTMKTEIYIVRETDNLWQRLVEISRNEFFIIYFDKNDNLYYTKNPMFIVPLPTPVMTFDKDFVVGEPIIEYHDPGLVRQVKLHSVTDESGTLHSEYPASPVHVYGNVEELSRIRCNVQAELDHWCYRQYQWLNRPYTVTWTAPGLCGLLFEIWDRVQITYAGTTANGVHVNWSNEKFWISNITVTPDDAMSGTSAFTLEAENS